MIIISIKKTIRTLILLINEDIYLLYLKFKAFFIRHEYKKNKEIFFIHIPKTAGTTISNIFKNKYFKNKIIIKGHYFRPFFLNKKNRYLLSIRDPIKRMESGFYQQRKDKADKIGNLIFKKYLTFNTLAENLIVNNKVNYFAIFASKYLYSLNEGYRFFFINSKTRFPHYIIEQENLTKDLNFFLAKLNIKNQNKFIRFKSTSNFKKIKLSNLAIKNIKKIYKKEFLIYSKLKKSKVMINRNFKYQV